MDHLGDLNLFLRVLDLGSISAAARSLDLSVAVASQRLKRLERGLGVRLLHRTTRQLRPTPEGIALAEQGRHLVEELDVLTSSLRKNAKGVAGTLRVSIPASFGRQYISPLLPEFMTRHPRLRLHIDLSDQLRDLVSEGFDLAIRIGTLKDSELVATRLASNRRVLCASPDYLRRHGVPKKPEDLAKHECLLMAVGRDSTDVWHLRGPDGQEINVRVPSRLKRATLAKSFVTPRSVGWAFPSTPPGTCAKTCAPGASSWCFPSTNYPRAASMPSCHNVGW